MIEKIKDYIKDEEFKMSIFENRIHVINYEEILSLENSRVSFKVVDKRIVLKGTNLTVKRLVNKELLLSGKISEIVFFDE